MVSRAARIRIGAFLALLLLNLAPVRLPLLPSGPLAGVEKDVPRAPLTPDSWWSGRFQQDFDRWFARRLPGRPHLVRTDNQISLSLFGQAPSGGTRLLLGLGGTIIEQAQLDQYNWPRRTDPARLAAFAQDLRRLQGLLERRGQQLVVVIAPTKVEIYPELNPPGFVVPGRAGRRSTYDELVPLLDAAGVTLVDGHRILLEERARGDVPVFPRGGTHWNHYGGALVASSLLAALDRGAPGRFVQLDVKGARTDRVVWATDDDLGQLLNVWWPRPWPGPQTHPVLETRSQGRVRPRLLFAGDSFTLALLDFMTGEGLIDAGESIFYFNRRARYPGGGITPLDRSRFDVMREFQGLDAVVLVSSEHWLHTQIFGFVAAALKSLEAEQAGVSRAGPPGR